MTIKKKGVSPVIATSLLIAMVVVVGLIVFMWFRGFTQEAVTKFGGTNIELVCQDAQFESTFSDGEIFLSNIGNVPIYSFVLKIERPGSHETTDISEITDWPTAGLNQGGVFQAAVAEVSSATEVTVIPVLRGTSDSGAKTHTCEERYGEQIVL